MGLAGERKKQRFGYDPRNTKWANNTNRFGHQYLEKLGWKPGDGLGLVDHAVTTHVKISFKEDNSGLGKKLGKKRKDNLDDESAGLDVFQKILGRLNGREEAVSKELEIQRVENIINGKYGMQFVKGAVLQSTWDSKNKKLKSEKKRRRGEEDGEDKRHKKDKKKKSKDGERKKSKDKVGKKSKGASTEEIEPLSAAPSNTSTNATRHIRYKYIRQKRAATMDDKALNEIFMITSK